MADDQNLFSEPRLTDALEGQRRAAIDALENWDPDSLLATPEADIRDDLVSKYSVTCPTLDRDRIAQLPVAEGVQVIPAWSPRLRGTERRVTKVVIVVPFDGEEDVFKYQASTFSLNYPVGQVCPSELRLTWLGDHGGGGDAASIRRHFEERLGRIEQHLSWAHGDIEQHNAQLVADVTAQLAKRRAKLLADRDLEAGLGFPVRRRQDAAEHAAPVTRRKVTATRRPTANEPFRAEPFLAEAQYEDALGVLRNARNALERSPSLTAKLSEERIRDLLLVLLNAQFEGAAAGEVFNGFGKTDILIRVERNIFIGECKIWKGPKTIRDALDQLFRYLVWRDTKAALVLFIRNGQPTEIIEKALTTIRTHPNFKRELRSGDAGERYDLVLHATGDPNREIRLAFLPFALRDSGGAS